MMTTSAPFLWGASTAPGNNVNSDWWVHEQRMPHFGLSGDGVDSYHRYEEDMRLLAEAGLNAYRFGIEWPASNLPPVRSRWPNSPTTAE